MTMSQICENEPKRTLQSLKFTFKAILAKIRKQHHTDWNKKTVCVNIREKGNFRLSDFEKSPFEQFNQNYIPGKVHVKIECNIWPVFSTTNQ